MREYEVQHAQKHWGKPDDEAKVARVTVRDYNTGEPAKPDEPCVFITGGGFGCSRNYHVPDERAIRRFLTDEHAQTVLGIRRL